MEMNFNEIWNTKFDLMKMQIVCHRHDVSVMYYNVKEKRTDKKNILYFACIAFNSILMKQYQNVQFIDAFEKIMKKFWSKNLNNVILSIRCWQT